MQRIILTGGPCTGKSSVFYKCLEKLDIPPSHYIPEIARKWIPWFQKNAPKDFSDKRFFQKFLEILHKQNFTKVEGDREELPVIYDRGLPDEIGYMMLHDMNIEATHLIWDCLKNFRYDKVFYFPFWDEIYKQDEVRTEDKEVAEKVGDYIKYGYIESGYELIIVPFGTIEERVEFIKSHL